MRGTEINAVSSLVSIGRIQFNLVATKVGRAVEELCISTVEEHERRLLHAVVAWIRVSGTKDDDPLLTRYAKGKGGAVGRRLTTRKDVNDVIKLTAGQLGLNPGKFSSKSFRVLPRRPGCRTPGRTRWRDGRREVAPGEIITTYGTGGVG